jgi:hypothetical protein
MSNKIIRLTSIAVVILGSTYFLSKIDAAEGTGGSRETPTKETPTKETPTKETPSREPASKESLPEKTEGKHREEQE